VATARDRTIQPISQADDLLGWPGGQPYLTSDVAASDVAFGCRAVDLAGATRSVAFIRTPSADRDHPWITALGDPGDVEMLVEHLLTEHGEVNDGGLVGGATVPASIRTQLSQRLLSRTPPIRWGTTDQGAPWDWWWAAEVRLDEPAAHEVIWLDAFDPMTADAIRTLLAVASPTHWAPPEHPHVTRWAGIVDQHGAVLACVAETLRIPGHPHLASVATHPDHRGRGMAVAVTGWMTQELLAEGAPLVSLGMYAHNDIARRVYTRLGYTCAYSWFSSGFASIPASERC